MTRPPVNGRRLGAGRLAAGVLALAWIAACAAPAPGPTPAGTSPPKFQIISQATRRLVGDVRAPAGAVRAAQGAAPGAGDAGASETSPISGEAVLAGALVYLIRQDDTLLTRNGRAVFALTDASGSFAFPDVPSEPLLVAVVLPGDRRVAGLVRPGDGESRIRVGVATTYVAAYLRERARSAGRDLAAYDLDRLGRLADLTANRIAAGDLSPDPDLAIDATPALARRYGVVAAARDRELAGAWEDLLGGAIPAIETLALPQFPEGEVHAVAVSASGDVYVADKGELESRVSRLGPGGPAILLEGSWPDRELGLALSLGMDGDGYLYVGDAFLGYVRRFRPPPVVGDPAAAARPVEADWTIGPDEIPVVPRSAFRADHPGARDTSPRGMVRAPDGTLYLADARNSRVLAIAPDGRARRVAGLAPAPAFDSTALAGFSGDGGPAALAALAHPNGVAWRAAGASGSLYVADTDNHRIRRIDLVGGTIETVAGSGPGFLPDAPPPGGFAGDGGPATAARLKYPTRVLVMPDGSLLVADSGNQRIRVVDAGGQIRTLAGLDPGAGGATAADGPADATVLGEVWDLALDPAGNVVFAALDRGVRKLWLHARD